MKARLEADAAQLRTRDLVHLFHLNRFIATTMIHHSGRYELIPSYSDDHKRANLRQAASDSKKQLRCAVSSSCPH